MKGIKIQKFSTFLFSISFVENITRYLLSAFICLVEAIDILLLESISKEALQKASLLLKKFHVQLRSLYGEQYQIFNAHNILHLVFCVKNLGSLFVMVIFLFQL